MRSVGSRGAGIKVFVRLIGTLFVRTVDRAERNITPCSPGGFRETSRVSGDPVSRRPIWHNLTAMVMFLAVFRFFRITEGIGCFAQGLLR